MRKEENIRAFMEDNFPFGMGGGLDYDTSLQEKGVLDSSGMLLLVEFIGEQFSIVVEDEEIVPENLDSINRIATFIEKKRAKVPIGLTI